MFQLQNGGKKYLDLGFIIMTYNSRKNFRFEDDGMFVLSKIEM